VAREPQPCPPRLLLLVLTRAPRRRAQRLQLDLGGGEARCDLFGVPQQDAAFGCQAHRTCAADAVYEPRADRALERDDLSAVAAVGHEPEEQCPPGSDVPVAAARFNLRPDLPDLALFPRSHWLAGTRMALGRATSASFSR
jgi:hypothetical protein